VSAGRKSALLFALSAALAAPAASAAAPAGGSEARASAASCRNGVVARISGQRKCLKTGRSCSLRYQSQYKRNGYSCRRTSKGYRLRKTPQEF